MDYRWTTQVIAGLCRTTAELRWNTAGRYRTSSEHCQTLPDVAGILPDFTEKEPDVCRKVVGPSPLATGLSFLFIYIYYY